MLSVKNLVKTYNAKKQDQKVIALNNISIDFPDTGLVFLLGKSGSGKSTLLNAIGGLDSFDSGEILIKGKSSKSFTQSDFDSYRNTFIGFIFQEYNILENFTVAKNIALAMELQGKKATHEKVNNILEQVDLLSYAKRKPNQLSGGQKQRVAIARALIKNPEIIMADEPTGALDSTTGKQVMETLKKLSRSKLVIIVSHDRDFAETYGDRIIELKDGKIISDTTKKEIESNKTNTGLSYVKDEFIHIKKGQELTNNDFDIIIDNILSNVNKSDTIISLNSSTTKEIKSIEGISEEGNRNVFSKTLPEDIKQEKNSKNLKLIKSKLNFFDSFKLGASALKNKVGKLVFTILLSFFAFTCFGVIDALSSWNKIDSIYSTSITLQDKNISLQKQKQYNSSSSYYGSIKISDDDLKLIKTKFNDYTFLPALQYYNSSIEINGESVLSTTKGLYSTYIPIYTSINELQLKDLGFSLEGRLPQNENEICLSKHVLDCLIKIDDNYANYQNLKISLSSLEEKTIVGIIDNKIDLSKYENITDSEINSNYQLQYDIQNFLKNSYTSAVYLHQDTFNKLSQNSMSSYYLYVGSTDLRYSIYPNELKNTNEEQYLYMNIAYYKNGKTFTEEDQINLGLNEIIMPKHYLEYYSSSNLNAEIDAGLNLTLKDDFNEDFATLKVVGYTDNYEYYASEETIEALRSKQPVNYDYILTQLHLQEEDREFITFCNTQTSDNTKYEICCMSTSTIQMLEGIISTAKTIFLYIAIAFAVFACLLLMNYISTSISYKKREIGVLRALGARSIDVFGIFFNESLLIAFINFVLSSIATLIICSVINNYLILSLGFAVSLFNASYRQIFLILGISVLAAFVASFLPVMKIAKKKPIDAINNR